MLLFEIVFTIPVSGEGFSLSVKSHSWKWYSGGCLLTLVYAKLDICNTRPHPRLDSLEALAVMNLLNVITPVLLWAGRGSPLCRRRAELPLGSASIYDSPVNHSPYPLTPPRRNHPIGSRPTCATLPANSTPHSWWRMWGPQWPRKCPPSRTHSNAPAGSTGTPPVLMEQNHCTVSILHSHPSAAQCPALPGPH